MDEYTITVPGTPPRKNRRHVIVVNRSTRKAHRKNSAEFLNFVGDLEVAATGIRKITDGVWHAEIVAYWPQQTRAIGHGLANADVDSPVSSIFDALQLANVIDDDKRFQTFSASKGYDKDNPRTIIRLERLR